MCKNARSALAQRMWGRRKISRNMLWHHKCDPQLRKRFFEDSSKLLTARHEPEKVKYVADVVMAMKDMSFPRLNRAVYNEMRQQYDLSKQ